MVSWGVYGVFTHLLSLLDRGLATFARLPVLVFTDEVKYESGEGWLEPGHWLYFVLSPVGGWFLYDCNLTVYRVDVDVNRY